MGWKRIADWLELCGCCGRDVGVEDQACVETMSNC